MDPTGMTIHSVLQRVQARGVIVDRWAGFLLEVARLSYDQSELLLQQRC